MSENQPLNLKIGSVLNGRYEILRALGRGSMGMVYCCRDARADGRLVAMKILFEEFAKDRVGVERFRNEILAAYKAVHRNVVQPFDYFEEGGLVAYTMEYIDGEEIASILSRGTKVEIPSAVNCLMEMCRGVQAIHSTGIVHRDLKPENVMLAKNGEIKIMDFGIARSLEGKKLTAHGALLGTVEYMSPEYLAEDKVHPLGDIYSLGVIGYELITGSLPHRGGGVLEVIQSKLHSAPVPPHELRDDCPIVLSKMVVKAMHANPEKRYQSARALLHDLATLGYESGVRIPTAELQPERVQDLVGGLSASEPEKKEAEKQEPEKPESADEPWDLIDEASETPLARGELSDDLLRHPSKSDSRRVALLGALLLLGILFLSYQQVRNSDSPLTDSSEEEHFVLVQAAANCDFEAAQALDPASIDPNEKDEIGDSALTWAVRKDCLPMVNFLIEKGADVNAAGSDGKTPLQWANESGFRDVENLLLHFGAEVRSPSE